MNIYCVYLTTYRGNKLPPFYIGYSTIKKINGGYHGSVASRNYKAIWRSEQKVNPHLFKTTILTTHGSKAEAMTREQTLQRHLNVIQNPLYVNRSIFPQRDTTGYKWSKASRLKLSLACKGRKASPETKQKMSLAHMGNQCRKGIPHTTETKIKMSLAHIGKTPWWLKGKSLTEEHKQKISLGVKRSRL